MGVRSGVPFQGAARRLKELDSPTRVHVYREDTLTEREHARNQEKRPQGRVLPLHSDPSLPSRSGGFPSGSGMFPIQPECGTLFAW